MVSESVVTLTGEWFESYYVCVEEEMWEVLYEENVVSLKV